LSIAFNNNYYYLHWGGRRLPTAYIDRRRRRGWPWAGPTLSTPLSQNCRRRRERNGGNEPRNSMANNSDIASVYVLIIMLLPVGICFICSFLVQTWPVPLLCDHFCYHTSGFNLYSSHQSTPQY
jgi:hypothetical protein